MLMGTCAGLFNHLKKKAWLRVFFEFIPEFLFLFCTFGYMCIMIFVKWNIDWHERSLWTEDENPNNLTTVCMFVRVSVSVSLSPSLCLPTCIPMCHSVSQFVCVAVYLFV